MELFLSILIGILLLTNTVCAIVKVRLKRRLDSIDGFVGTTQNYYNKGKIIGGQFENNTVL